MLQPDEIIWLEVASQETEKLNEWENIFVESLSDKEFDVVSLTINQRNKLKTIYDKVV